MQLRDLGLAFFELAQSRLKPLVLLSQFLILVANHRATGSAYQFVCRSVSGSGVGRWEVGLTVCVSFHGGS